MDLFLRIVYPRVRSLYKISSYLRVGSNEKEILRWLLPDSMKMGFIEEEKDFPFLKRCGHKGGGLGVKEFTRSVSRRNI